MQVGWLRWLLQQMAHCFAAGHRPAHWAIAVRLRLYGSQQGIEYSFCHIGLPLYLIYFFTKEALEDRAHNR